MSLVFLVRVRLTVIECPPWPVVRQQVDLVAGALLVVVSYGGF